MLRGRRRRRLVRRRGRATADDPAFDPGDRASVRAQFPLTDDAARFAAYVLAAHPRPAADAIARHRAGLDEDTEGYLAAIGADAETACATPPRPTSASVPSRWP